MPQDVNNRGVIHGLHLGMMAGPGALADLPVIIPDGNGEPFLPVYEKQSRAPQAGDPPGTMYESMNCVQYSRASNCEAWAKFFGKVINIADRAWYWLTGCTANGNSYSACDYHVRRGGGCKEASWPWDRPMSRAEYGKEPPEDVKAEMLKLLEEWDFGRLIWVDNTPEAMREALTKSPMLWACNEGHSFGIYRVDDRIRVFDTYGDQAEGKGSFPLSYAPQLVAVYIAPFTPKGITPAPMIQLPPNCLVAVVDGPGERLMNVDGSALVKDDAGKIDLELEARNSKPCPESTCEHCEPGKYVPHRRTASVPVVNVKAADVAHLKRKNLKGEDV